MIHMREKIEQADMVLIGLGEEFQRPAQEQAEYERGRGLLREAEYRWLLPAWDDFCSRSAGADTVQTLEKLAGLLVGKNYFVVSVAMNFCIWQTPWKEGRLVMPCGGSHKLQCSGSCGEAPVLLSGENEALLDEVMEELSAGSFFPEKLQKLGRCKKCGAAMVLNNIYADRYNEEGYLAQWNLYTKWLQGTLNRKLLILELGVGMQFPSVIRFPFEKIAFFNQKAEFIRIHGKLYQLTEELKGKGCGISQNAIDWLRNL